MEWHRGKFFEIPGSLFPHDFRHDPADRAFLDRDERGSLRFRLWTEPDMTDVHLVVGIDGHAMHNTGVGSRFAFWEVELADPPAEVHYTFAARDRHGDPTYFGNTGTTGAVEGPYGEFVTRPGELEPFVVPEWARGAVVYQVFPDRFAIGDDEITPDDSAPWGSEPHWRTFQGGDLVGLKDRLDYIADLGVDAIYLNPIFASPSTHKYDTTDFMTVDPALGGDAALANLVEAAHAREIRVLLDGVFDHCHPDFFAFADARANGPDSEFWGWFDFQSDAIEVRFRPQARAPWHTDEFLASLRQTLDQLEIPLVEVDDPGPPLEPSYKAWYHVPTMPQVNLDYPPARQYFLEVARYWITEFDVDGWRMDVAREPSYEFWRACRVVIKEAKPDAYVLAEIWGDTSPWLQGDQFDATMNYTFRDLCAGYFATRTLTSQQFADGLLYMQHMYAAPVTAVSHNLLSSHDIERFLHTAAGEVDAFILATIFQLTFTGAPGLYYGDEVGMSGDKDASRGPFPWHAEEGWNRELLDLTRSLTGLRRSHPALRFGDFKISEITGRGIVFTRSHRDEELAVAINNSTAPMELELRDADLLFGELPVPPMRGVIARRSARAAEPPVG